MVEIQRELPTWLLVRWISKPESTDEKGLMAYSLHFVPQKRTSEVLMSILDGDSLGAPLNQRTWPNWVLMLRDLSPYLEEQERRDARVNLSAGRTHWLPQVWLSDSDMERLGL
jgi:hypothetical protein